MGFSLLKNFNIFLPSQNCRSKHCRRSQPWICSWFLYRCWWRRTGRDPTHRSWMLFLDNEHCSKLSNLTRNVLYWDPGKWCHCRTVDSQGYSCIWIGGCLCRNFLDIKLQNYLNWNSSISPLLLCMDIKSLGTLKIIVINFVILMRAARGCKDTHNLTI